MGRIEAVIFDFGGVVAGETRHLSTSERIKEVWNICPEQAENFGHVYTPLMELMVAGRLPPDEFWRQMSVQFNRDVPNGSFELLGESVRDSFLYPEMVEFACELKQKGLWVPVLSNATLPQGEANKQRGAYVGFDPVLLSCEMGLAKPDPEIYSEALRRLGLPAPACIFVDDVEKNLVPARELGIRCVLARNPAQVIEEVRGILGM